MALTIATVQPSSAGQLGTVATIVGGSANAAAALSDGSNTTYVSFAAEARLDSQVVRLGFSLPTLPAGAQIYSVTLRRTIQTVVAGPPVPGPPICNHWFRTITGTIQVAGQISEVTKNFFTSTCPVSQVVSVWTSETVASFDAAPGGAAWNAANLTGFTYDMGRGDTSTTSTLNVSEVYLDIQYQQLSSVTVTAPTGTSTATRPTVTWTYSSPDSQPQASYRVAIYTQAQTTTSGFSPMVTTPLQDSGTVLGETLSWTLTSDVTDGSYVAFVQATSRWAGPGSFPTSIASSSWTRAATPANPPPPALLTAAVFDIANNRVGLTFTPGGTSPVTNAFTVQASRNGSPLTMASIPSLTFIPANGSASITVYDYVAPINIASLYQVIAYSGSPYVAAVAPSGSLSVTPTGVQHWLKSPSNPLLNTPLPVAAPEQASDGIKITKPRMQGTFRLLGPVGSQIPTFVINGPTYGEEYAIDVIFTTPTELNVYWPAVDQLDRSGETLLFQKPDGTQVWVVMGPGASGQETEETYDAVPGNPTRVYWRRRKFTLTQVPAPSYY